MTRTGAPRVDVVDELFGHRIADPYRWLEDDDDPRTRAWLAGQDRRYAAARTGWPRWPARRVDRLYAVGTAGVPVFAGKHYFFLRQGPGDEHETLYVVAPHQPARPLLDPGALDATGLTTVDAWQPSPTGDLVAYQTSRGGTESATLRILDVASGDRLPEVITGCRYASVAWLPGGDRFFYVRRPARVPAGEELLHRQVWLHRVGSAPEDDLPVFGAGRDPRADYALQVSVDGRWLAVVGSRGAARHNDLWLADLDQPGGWPPRLRPVTAVADAYLRPWLGHNGRLYLLTDDRAARRRLCVTDPADPAHSAWRELVGEDPDAVLTWFAPLDSALVAIWTRHGISEMTVHDPDTGARVGAVGMPGKGTVIGVSTRPEGGDEMWFGYTDRVTPPSVHHYHARTRRRRRWIRPAGVVPATGLRTEQVTYESADGAAVRMLVLSGRGAGPRPAILSAYGGFGVSASPTYSPDALAWARAGGVYAVAHVRGGGEEGEQWHRSGMREHKTNSFQDLHAAAEHLVADGWTTPDQLGLYGSSNGGLVVGAALVQRPELYRAVVCVAPLLDMVRYERFGLGALWSAEYGTAADPRQLRWLLAYSPYHQVRPGVRYPAVLFMVFDGDTRVHPMHARKMCAALQHATAGGPVLLRREGDAGHGRRSTSRASRLSADALAFLAGELGLSSQ